MPDAARIEVRALLVAERIETRALPRERLVGAMPSTISVGATGRAVLFRYGAVVLFDVEEEEADRFLDDLAPHLAGPLAAPESEEAEILTDPAREDGVEPGGAIRLHEMTVERTQLVAEVLAKSVVLAHYETALAAAFDRIEPLATALQSPGWRAVAGSELLRHIGDALAMQHKMIGRAEVLEKPELLWDHPELERLYARLVDEYELRERERALERKLELIARTVETLIDLQQARRSLRVEWYIVLLILADILVSLVAMLRGG